MADRRDWRSSFVVLGLSRTAIETKIKSGSVGLDTIDAINVGSGLTQPPLDGPPFDARWHGQDRSWGTR
jgi:hypothetical protein